MVDFMKLSRMKSKVLLLIAGIFVALLIIIMLQGCHRDDVQPTQMVTGGDLEAGTSLPIGWYYDNGQNNYSVAWTEEEAASPKRSLKIFTQVSSITNFAFWGLSINTNIPVGKDVTLKVKIKSKLSGSGVSLAIRGDDTEYPQGSAEQFKSTQGNISITGNVDWREYNVKLEKVGTNIKSLTVYLVYLQNTTGDVYFDDVSLTY